MENGKSRDMKLDAVVDDDVRQKKIHEIGILKLHRSKEIPDSL